MKIEDLRIGMKVKIKRNAKDIRSNLTFVHDMENYLGKEVTIYNIDSDRYIQIDEDRRWNWDVKWLESIKFNKSLIKDGVIVTLSNGDELIYDNHVPRFIDLREDHDNCLYEIDDIDDNGNVGNYYITSIKYPSDFTTIYEKSNEVKEMTLKEVCKELGYEVKIIKEDK